jgi:ABC-type lipoprotein release transport system permease subunit
VLYEVAMMALLSIIIGTIVGLGANYWISQTGITLSEGMTYGGVEFTTMKGEVNARSFYIPAIAVIISALLVSLYPAGKAARVAPARAMRMH